MTIQSSGDAMKPATDNTLVLSGWPLASRYTVNMAMRQSRQRLKKNAFCKTFRPTVVYWRVGTDRFLAGLLEADPRIVFQTKSLVSVVRWACIRRDTRWRWNRRVVGSGGCRHAARVRG